MKEFEARHPWIFPALLVLLLIFLGVSGYFYYTLYLSSDSYAVQVKQLNEALQEASTTNADLSDALASERARNDAFEGQINGIASTVGTLDKLSKTDPQLLAKYSKVYFLNENYAPSSITKIPAEYTYPDKKDYEFLTPALPHLEDMIDDAKEDGVDLEVLSAYRSFGDQASLKTSYKVTYGTGANTFSADQGYSEHQLGTAVDLTTKSVGATFVGFEKTDAYAWLVKHAHRYGFVLSYPPNNKYYVYEPWHWRYVGIKLASKLHSDKQYFYDLDQREINTYLVDLF